MKNYREISKKSAQASMFQWVGVGPSIRARARFALSLAFLIATPVLILSVVRASKVSEDSSLSLKYDVFARQVAKVRLNIEEVKTLLWRFDAQPELEHERAVQETVDTLRQAVVLLGRKIPDKSFEKPVALMGDMVNRAQNAITLAMQLREGDEKSGEQVAVARARLMMASITTDTTRLENVSQRQALAKEDAAQKALSNIGRDLLLSLLMLLFAIPIFVGILPGWLVSPLIRLKRMGQHIEAGRIRELQVSGKDEISQLAQVLQDALEWREELDNKKSAKIFEVRNVLRSVLTLVDVPVLILDRHRKVNYANQQAANLFALESHQLEGMNLLDQAFAPMLLEEVDKAFEGEITQSHFHEKLELADGRVHALQIRLVGVRSREGEVSRVVVVLRKE